MFLFPMGKVHLHFSPWKKQDERSKNMKRSFRDFCGAGKMVCLLNGGMPFTHLAVVKMSRFCL